MTYWVVVIHQKGHMPRFMSDSSGNPLTLDCAADAKNQIVRWWRTEGNKNSPMKHDPQVLRMTVVKLED